MRTVPLDITAPAPASLRAPRTATDRCPTAIALHPAADGLIARVRLPGGRLSAAQARVLADFAAGALGAREVAASAVTDRSEARIELTVRGNLQIRGLAAQQAGPLAAALHGAGLLPSEPHDQARTIVASPVAGRLPGTVMVDRLVDAIDAALCVDPELVALSGRFLMAIDDGGGTVESARADLALVAEAGSERHRWRAVRGGTSAEPPFSAGAIERALTGERFTLLVGGVAAGTVAAGQAPAAVIAAARAFVREARGAAWRISELADGGAALRAALLSESTVAPVPGGRRSFARAALPPLGVGRQADGRSFVRAGSVLGRLTPAQLLVAADAAQAGHTAVRLATDRSLTLCDLAPKHAAAALEALAGAGLATAGDAPSVGLTACAGLGCATSRGDVRGAAELRLRTRRPGAAREHLVGCERRCGAPSAGTTLVLAEHESPESFAARAAAAAEEISR